MTTVLCPNCDARNVAEEVEAWDGPDYSDWWRCFQCDAWSPAGDWADADDEGDEDCPF